MAFSVPDFVRLRDEQLIELPNGNVLLQQGRAVSRYIEGTGPDSVVRTNLVKGRHEIKGKLATVSREEGAAFFSSWTQGDKAFTTRRLDDILTLTAEGDVRQATVKPEQHGQPFYDIQVYRKTLHCSGQGNCRRQCGGLGECTDGCQGPRNKMDKTHKCNFKVHISATLTDVKLGYRRLTVEGEHVPADVDWVPPKARELRPAEEVKDTIRVQRERFGTTAVKVVKSLVADVPCTTEVNSRYVPREKQVRRYIERTDRVHRTGADWEELHKMATGKLKAQGSVLLYQRPSTDSPHYMLVIADKSMLHSASKHGRGVCFMDSKHDTNDYKAPFTVVIAENHLHHAVPVAFQLANVENQDTLGCFLEAVRRNVPCTDPDCSHPYLYEDTSGNGSFARRTPCSGETPWGPACVIDKHGASRLALEGMDMPVLLCWFHIVKALGEAMEKTLGVPEELMETVTLAFKFIGRSEDRDEAWARFELMKTSISSTGMDEIVCERVIQYVEKHWMTDRWLDATIDGTRRGLLGQKWPTTNNKAERLLRSIDDDALDRLVCHNVSTLATKLTGVHPDGSKTTTAGLMQLWALRASDDDDKEHLPETRWSKEARYRQLDGRVLFLLNTVQPTGREGVYYVLLGTDHTADNDMIAGLQERLVPTGVIRRDGCHIANILTGECTCMDYVLRGCGMDRCKHVQAAGLFHDAADREVERGQVAKFLRNRERLQPAERKRAAFLSPDNDEVFAAHCREMGMQPIPAVPEREPQQGGRPTPLHQKRPWRRLTTAYTHQPRIPSRTRKVKGAKPRRPARLTAANRRQLEPPDTDEISCNCGKVSPNAEWWESLPKRGDPVGKSGDWSSTSTVLMIQELGLNVSSFEVLEMKRKT
uniref:SWIM-type domain-containing protein n=1 Tax=Branchiostoma floridae TaxID=7739 RepID=C3YP26_BRAFL|eukprot:XP_002601905.1 hypothetical protein BRAFLDRAFT_86389 [Branchiostoma floridae]